MKGLDSPCRFVMGRFVLVTGRFAASPGGAASPLPDSPPYREGSVPAARDSPLSLPGFAGVSIVHEN